MKLRYAIFDLDGTLLDSMPVWDALAARYLTDHGRQPEPGLRRTLAKLDMTGSAQYLIAQYGLGKDVRTVIDEMNALALTDYRDRVPLKHGAGEFLRALQARGVKMCVATATDRPLVEAALARLGVRDCFAGLFTCTEVGASKSRPDIFRAALAHMGGGLEDTVVFEDSLHAIRTAKAAGFRVAAVPDDAALHDRAEIRALADDWFDSYREALAALES